jgi:hypothetical protein
VKSGEGGVSQRGVARGKSQRAAGSGMQDFRSWHGANPEFVLEMRTDRVV